MNCPICSWRFTNLDGRNLTCPNAYNHGAKLAPTVRPIVERCSRLAKESKR